jgi:amidase
MVTRIHKVPTERLTQEANGVLGPYAKPIARVKPGEEVEVETWDCNGGVIHPGQTRQHAIDRGIPYVSNPVTGPIYVEDAEPGDALAVDILDINMVSPGFICLNKGIAPIKINIDKPYTTFIDIVGDGVHYPTESGRTLVLDAEPFIGTIGVSPPHEAIATITPGPHGGNMDCSDIRAGNRLILPVSRPGALFGLGDAHALQGDGEVCGTAVEISSVTRLRFSIIKGAKIAWPRVESPDEIMTLCSAKPLEDATRLAFQELVNWMATDYGWHRDDAYMFLSIAAKARIAQIVDPLYTVAAKLPKKYLQK